MRREAEDKRQKELLHKHNHNNDNKMLWLNDQWLCVLHTKRSINYCSQELFSMMPSTWIDFS